MSYFSTTVSGRIDPASVTRRSQGYSVLQLDTVGGYKVRYVLDVDTSYSGQSQCSIEVFSPAALQWNPLWHITPRLGRPMPKWTERDAAVSGAAPENVVAALDRLAKELLDTAVKILP
ncbi:MAG: hypothetical protein L0H59_13525 [Tomitella sp.]|nr:hypothetical protein [Tomitella sp.]